MGIGCLLDGDIVPLGGVEIILPAEHAVEKVRRRLRYTVKNAIDERDRFGTGYGVFGTEGGIGIARDPALFRRTAYLRLRPVARKITEGGCGCGAAAVEPGRDGGELGAGYGPVGAEAPVRIALQNAEGRHGGDRSTSPRAERP